MRLEWEEAGTWRQDGDRPTPYRNRLRWEWDGATALLRLSHLRRGPDAPTHLADLVPQGADRFGSVAPHDCAPDLYLAELVLSADRLELTWRVTGPAKSYTLLTHYTP